MAHIQNDNGTLVIGTQRRWLITDPGYEQYMQDAEREFTLGPAAHNYPVINGAVQCRKQPRLLRLENGAEGSRAQVELAECYSDETGALSVTRSVCLMNTGIVVCDQICADRMYSLTYHWHGHPDAAWWSENGWILLHLPDADLWFTCPQVRLSRENIQRLPGSRGQLSLAASVAPPNTTVWWVFALSAQNPRLESRADGRAIEFLGKHFE